MNPGVFNRKFQLRHLLPLPILAAACGFSIALATAPAPRSAASVPASGRAIGSNFQITNPFLLSGQDPAFTNGGASADPQGFDLGDACRGRPFTRFISLKGGLQPHSFTLRPLLDVTNTAGGMAPPLPSLSSTGLLSGPAPSAAQFAGSALRFSALVSDLLGNEQTGTFRLNLVDCPTLFRFAHDRLPRAVQGRSYFTNIETVGVEANDTASFQVVPGSVAVVGVGSLSGLEEAGLVLARDGTLFGRPVKNGDITFTARAVRTLVVDAAKDRDGRADDQAFRIKMESGQRVSSEVLATRCSIRGSLAFPDQDSLLYSGVIDAKGDSAASLAGTPFVLRVGQERFSGTLDEKGRVDGPLDASGRVIEDLKAAAAATGPGRLSVSLSPSKGRLQIKLTGVSLAAGINIDETLAGKSNRTAVLAVEAGVLRSSEVLRLATVAAAGSFKMDYALGSRGYSRNGGFQVASVKGSDAKTAAGEEGARWRVKFLAVPPQDDDGAASASATISAAGSTQIVIGESFTQDVSVALNRVNLIFKATAKDAGILNLKLDPRKFKHSLETNPIDSLTTLIPQASQSKDATQFRFGMDITNFKGEAGRVIVPDRASWKQR